MKRSQISFRVLRSDSIYMLKIFAIIIFLAIAFAGFSSDAAAQTRKSDEQIATWKYQTKTYKLELTLKFAAGKLSSYALDAYRLTRGGESANECGALIDRNSANVAWKDSGSVTRATGKDEQGIPIDIEVETRKNGFFVKSNFCENVGIPNVLLTKKGKTYVGQIVR